MNQGIFTAKLQELEREYGRMGSLMELWQQEEPEKLRGLLDTVTREFQANQHLLEKTVEGSRSPAIAALAQAQLDYYRKAGDILEARLPGYLHSEDSTPGEDRQEAAALYAEYAMDLAAQSIRYAMMAALKALEMQ